MSHPCGNQLLREQVEAVLDTLAPEQKDIIGMLYGLFTGEPVDVDEIAAEFGITPEEVEQIEREAMEEMRSHRPPELPPINYDRERAPAEEALFRAIIGSWEKSD